MRCHRQVYFVLGVGLAVTAAHGQLIPAARVASGLSLPLYATAPADDSSRLFVVEQGTGTSASIKIVNLAARTVEPTPFLTINGVSTGGERGLLGLAFHPQYSANGQFYVSYTDSVGALQVSQYTVSGNPNIGNPASALPVVNISQPFSNHNGGWIGFGPDNYLYVASGDGGSGNDPNNYAQNTSDGNLLGKILRIDANADAFPGDGNRNYAIPPSNPFVGTANDPEIWAYGLRNPWRPSFDQLTGDFYIADVGQNAREEVNFQPANATGGANYGWRAREGSIQTPGLNDPFPPGAIDPIHEYAHVAGPDGGFSITGGYVYRGTLLPELYGHYFFADYVTNQIWSFRMVDGATVDFTNRTSQFLPDLGLIGSISSFGQNSAGELFIVDHGGEVFMVIPEPAHVSLFLGTLILVSAFSWARFRRNQGICRG